jgi:hypothetical protein
MFGWLEWRWLGVFIAPQPSIQSLGKADVDGRTRHCPVHHPRHPTVRVLTVSTVGALSSGSTGHSGAAPDRQCSLFSAPSSGCSDSARTVCALFTLQATVGVDRCSR